MKTTNLDPEHQLDVTRGRKSTLRSGSSGITVRDGTNTGSNVWDVTVIGGTWTVSDDGTAILTIGGGGGGDPIVVGEVDVAPGATPVTLSSGSDFRGFAGVAWLTSPDAAEHGVGDKFLTVYYHGTTHLTGGTIVGRICTVTNATTWAYTIGSEFNIDTTNTPRCDDAVSVLDIDGAGDYRAVVTLREYNGVANHTPRILVCNTAAASMTTGSTWSSYNVGLSGHTQDYIVGRVLKLANGRFMVVYHTWNGATHTGGVAWTMDITDWSSPTFEEVNNSTSHRDEMDVEEVSAGTLYINIRNDTTGNIESAVSTDSGDTWSAPSALFAGTHFPTWRLLNSGVAILTYAAPVTNHVAYRQTPSGITNSGYGAETLIESTPSTVGAYATILQLDNNHVLIIYGVESTEPDPIDSDLYSIVFLDTTVFGTASVTDLDDLGDATVTSPAEDDTLRYVGGEWVNDNRRWEAVTNGTDVFVWVGTDLVHEWKEY